MKSMFTCAHGGSCAGKCVDCGLLVLRIGLAVIFIYHGWGKLFGNAPGIGGFTGMLTNLSVPLPAFFAWVVSLLEFFGGIAVLVGVFVRPIAALLAINMLAAFFLVKKGLPAGDPDLALFAMAVALALAGGGAYALTRQHNSEPEAPNKPRAT
ncbi:MAG: DoxX family protein [bacterium]|nr:DoxX family protein [bacterium]